MLMKKHKPTKIFGIESLLGREGKESGNKLKEICIIEAFSETKLKENSYYFFF